MAQSHEVLHQELVARHKQNYRKHAVAVLAGVKEFQDTDDCGTLWVKPNGHLVASTNAKLGLTTEAAKSELCEKIAADIATPELDSVVSDYVCNLTGKTPTGERLSLLK